MMRPYVTGGYRVHAQALQVVPEGRAGHKGVFGRIQPEGRLPIREMTTISIPQMLASKMVSAAALAQFREKLPDVLAHEVEYWLSQVGK